MISNNSQENESSVVFGTNRQFINPSTTNNNNNNLNNNYDAFVGDMLDTELDSDPQISDSELSWQSVTDVDSLTATNHWRGWKQQTTTTSSSANNININNLLPSNNSSSICFSSLGNTNEDRIPTLVDLSAQTIARHIPFELVERYNQPAQPVPDNLQLKIAFYSFPDGIEDIRLYTCVANGSTDEFIKAEALQHAKAVQNMLQIGFHLSAQVYEMNSVTNSTKTTTQYYHVSIIFDRKKITSCHCTCNNSSSWCSHIVAVCLCRIAQPQNCCLRAPVSESLSRLKIDQLRKFAQYLIWEIPQQFLPKAQSLLDELLSDKPTNVNMLQGAPDPTAGGLSSDISVWFLDENSLQENINKTLHRFCQPAPQVVGDVTYLTSPPILATTEYSNLLRPLRGREPEGMWNLLQIVREMLARHDLNGTQLLDILTRQCLAQEQIIQWWFTTKVSNVYNERGTNGLKPHSTLLVQQASAALCDEIVQIWRLIALNPRLNFEERHAIYMKLCQWHLSIIERICKQKTTTTNISTTTNGVYSSPTMNSNHDRTLNQKRRDIEIFSGFLPAIEICQIDWQNCEDLNVPIEEQSNERPWSEYIRSYDEILTDAYSKLNTNTSFNFNTQQQIVSQPIANNQEDEQDNDSGEELSTSGQNTEQQSLANSNDDCQIYFSDPTTTSQVQTTSTVVNEPYVFKTLKIINDPLQIAFVRCEALKIHGYHNEVFQLAIKLAGHMLDEYSLSSQDCLDAHISEYSSSAIARCAFLCTILNESSKYHQLAFRIGLLGLEICRLPATTKALEVRLLHCEQEICQELKKITLGQHEIDLLRQRAEHLCARLLNARDDAILLPLNLATYIFETLRSLSLYRMNLTSNVSLSQNFSISSIDQLSNQSNESDELLAFDAAICALGAKCFISEAQNPILCEGIRRQRSDLALNLLTLYKDDQGRLIQILDKLLDRDIHVLFKNPNINPFNVGSKRASQNSTSTQQTNSNSPSLSTRVQNRRLTTASNLNGEPLTEIDSSGLDESEGENFDQKAWEAKFRCLNLKTSSKRISNGFTSIDSSAPETNSSDNSPTVARRNIRMTTSKVNADSESDSERDTSQRVRNDSSTRTDTNNSSTEILSSPTIQLTTSRSTSTIPKSVPLQQQQQQQQQISPNSRTLKLNKGHMNNSNGKNRSPCTPNQPSEALCHFMFELAKTLVQRAGGTSSTSLFVGPTHNYPPPHRNLHLCAITIALYALGVNNHVQTNWMIRTYSSLVSWITSTAIDIGLQAIQILIECWEGQLTPPECAVIADRASRSRDSAVVRTAAELALSTLKYAHALNPAEIRQALVQCKEQSPDMLERGLTTIENATRDGNLVFIDILFEVAKRWYEMYYSLTGDSLNSDDDSTVVDIRQSFDTNSSTASVGVNPMDLHWTHANGLNSSSSSSSLATTSPSSPMMYAANNQTTNFPSPFQTHPSAAHFNTHAYMIPTQHGPPPPPPPSMHHHQLGNFHPQVPYQQIIPIQYTTGPPPPPQQQQQQQQQHFAFHTGQPNNFHPHAHHPRHPPPPQQQQQLPNAILVTPGNFPTAFAVHHTAPGNNPQMYPLNQNQQQSFYPARQIPLVVSSPTESTISPSASTTNATVSTQQTTIVSPSTTPSAEQQQQQQQTDPNHRQYLLNAFRVGMLAMNTLALERARQNHAHIERRSEQNHPTPRYGEDVKWLLKIALKLGNAELQEFVTTATAVIVNPYLLHSLAFNIYNVSQNNPNGSSSNQMLRLPFVQSLMQKCLHAYTRCVHSKMAHMTTNNDIDELTSLMKHARSAFLFMGNTSDYQGLMNFVKTSKKCKKDVYPRLWQAIQN